MIDLGTGNNNKINWAMNDKQEFIDIVETVYRWAHVDLGVLKWKLPVLVILVLEFIMHDASIKALNNTKIIFMRVILLEIAEYLFLFTGVLEREEVLLSLQKTIPQSTDINHRCKPVRQYCCQCSRFPLS